MNGKCRDDARDSQVAARLDRDLQRGVGMVASDLWLSLHWLRHHAPQSTYSEYLKWAERIAPIGGE